MVGRLARTTWLLSFAVALAPRLAAAERPAPAPQCLPGRYALEGRPAAPSASGLDGFSLAADGALTLPGCRAFHTHVQSGRGWTFLRTALVCERRRRLELSAWIHTSECRLEGRLEGFGMRPRAIRARRVAPPEMAPRELAAEIEGGEIQMHWRPPDPASGMTEVRLLRRLNQPPADAYDPLAALVFSGSAAAASEPISALLPDTAESPHMYHYAAFGCRPDGSCEPIGSRTAVAPTLAQALAAGGYVIHWRHASATVCNDFTFYGPASDPKVPDWWRSCESDCRVATARQLDEAGRHEAQTIGAELRARGVPFGRVLTSEYCRNVETALRMALGPEPEQTPAITFFVYGNERCRDSWALLAEPPEPGTNTALIGHSGFGYDCPVLERLAWGEAAVFKPDGLGGAELVAHLHWDEWSELP
jgi:hypothetical protein